MRAFQMTAEECKVADFASHLHGNLKNFRALVNAVGYTDTY
jgi:hypothetical protein